MAADESDYAQGIWKESPNYGYGSTGVHGRPQPITGIVMHGTAGGGAVSWFQNPASQVSAHYVVDTDGLVTQCVRDTDVAWHAGVVTPTSKYVGTDPNLYTLGVEHVRDTTNSSPLTAKQQAASIALITDLRRRHGPLPLIPHDAIDVGRVCPGPGFPLALIDKEAHITMKELPIPTWNQLNDPLPDGQQDPFATTDCGEESVAMVGKAYGGPELPAGQVRMILRGGNVTGPGVSSGDDLVFALSAVFKLRSHVRACNAVTFQIEATRSINAGMPVIALGRWVDPAALHWLVGRGADGTGFLANDPWGGKHRFITWSDVAHLYAGTYIHLDQSMGTLPV